MRIIPLKNLEDRLYGLQVPPVQEEFSLAMKLAPYLSTNLECPDKLVVHTCRDSGRWYHCCFACTESFLLGL